MTPNVSIQIKKSVKNVKNLYFHYTFKGHNQFYMYDDNSSKYNSKVFPLFLAPARITRASIVAMEQLLDVIDWNSMQ